MQLFKTDYNPELLKLWKEKITSERISELFGEFTHKFAAVIGNIKQQAHFEAYLKGLASDLERKSIEPIAIALYGIDGVRNMQQFITRSPFDDVGVAREYRKIQALTINSDDGMLSVDDTGFVKKGNNSVGVKRQYCGRLGKVENCQVVVNAAYAGENGYGIVDKELYIPQEWFDDDHAELRLECGIPKEKSFKTKNEIALDLINKVIEENLLKIKWIGGDSAFGCDHDFVDSLPKNVNYFLCIPKTQKVFLPTNSEAVTVEFIAQNDDFKWEEVGFETSKGVRNSQIKIVRVFSCRDNSRATEIWLYIRRYPDKSMRFAISNASENAAQNELHQAAKLRWPIEQCFEECKSYLGMADYEIRSYSGLMRHLGFVMIAHLFATSLRLELKKQMISP